MKSKKPGYRAGGPASRVRPRTPARRVAGKPTPLQTEQMRAAATLASKQAASKRRATLAQRKRMMAAKKNRPAQPNAQPLSKRMTAANMEIRLRADLNRARAKAAAPKAKSAIHGSLEAFAAAASTKNKSTSKAKLKPQTPRQTLNKRKAPTKPNTIGRGQVNKRFKGITSNVKRGNIDR